MKNRVDEHDMTKKMLSTIRDAQRLKEYKDPMELDVKPNNQLGAIQPDKGPNGNYLGPTDATDNPNMDNQAMPTNDGKNEPEDTITPSQEEMAAEYEKFSQVVSSRVEFTTFKIYPEANNVILGGVFQGMSGLEWQFSLEDEDGLYITVNNLQVDDNVMTTLQKLKGYYDNWADEWSQKLNTEYKANSSLNQDNIQF